MSSFNFFFLNIIRQKSRFLVIALIVCICCLVINLIGGLYNYMFISVYQNEVDTMGDCYCILKNNNQNSFNRDILSKIDNISGIKNYVKRGKISGVIGFEDKSAVYSGILFDKESEKEFYKDTDVSVKMGTILSNFLQIKVGDTFSGITESGGFSAVLEEIKKQNSEEEDAYFLALPFSAAALDNEIEAINSLHFHTIDENTIKELKELFSDSSLYEFHTAKESNGYFDSVKNIFNHNLVFIIVALCITTFFSLSIFFSIIVNERISEIGIQKVLGKRDSRIIFTGCSEALVISILGFIVGVLLSICIGFIINVVGGIVIPPLPTLNSSIIVKFTPSIKYFFISFITVIPVSVISGFYGFLAIRKKSIKECLNL